MLSRAKQKQLPKYLTRLLLAGYHGGTLKRKKRTRYQTQLVSRGKTYANKNKTSYTWLQNNESKEYIRQSTIKIHDDIPMKNLFSCRKRHWKLQASRMLEIAVRIQGLSISTWIAMKTASVAVYGMTSNGSITPFWRTRMLWLSFAVILRPLLQWENDPLSTNFAIFFEFPWRSPFLKNDH